MNKISVKTFIVPILLLFSSLSCTENASTKSQESWNKQNLRNLNVTDSLYQTAIKNAKDSISFFIKQLKDKSNNKLEYYIKSKFQEGETIEHMWLIVDSINNDVFNTTLDNVPDKLQSVKLNDHIKVNSQDVEDWIIYKGDSILYGNFISRSLEK